MGSGAGLNDRGLKPGTGDQLREGAQVAEADEGRGYHSWPDIGSFDSNYPKPKDDICRCHRRNRAY